MKIMVDENKVKPAEQKPVDPTQPPPVKYPNHNPPKPVESRTSGVVADPKDRDTTHKP